VGIFLIFAVLATKIAKVLTILLILSRNRILELRIRITIVIFMTIIVRKSITMDLIHARRPTQNTPPKIPKSQKSTNRNTKPNFAANGKTKEPAHMAKNANLPTENTN